MIALLVLAAAIANVALVVLLAERFGSEGQVSAGELASLQATDTATVAQASVSPANENAFATRARRAA